jgi:peptide deformylase
MVVSINKADNEAQLRILRTPATRGEVGPAALLAVDLIDTAKNYEICMGLASNQIWTKENEPIPHVFVVNISDNWKVFINATAKRSGKYFSFEEGCMSKPGYKKRCIRREIVTVSYMDEEGTPHVDKFVGMPAIIIQHELDHMTGKLI